MRNDARVPIVLVAVASIGLVASLRLVFPREAPSQQASRPQDNQELRGLHDEDQADRSPRDNKPIDWTVVGPRDRARLSRVKTLFSEDALKTANDYYHAAMILQHGDAPEDFLLAHEF